MAPADDNLDEYRDKRDFERTSEPAGNSGDSSEEPIFVIQKHDANTLHYDFRLEVDGVLKSWAVPKGPSMNPADKRLAIPTEDHPMEYADFEGAIPEDEYGGGTVMIWDRGTYDNLKEEQTEEGDEEYEPMSMSEALANGHATFRLNGDKLNGGFALIRTGGGDDARWLLIKMKDDAADPDYDPVHDRPESAVSDMTIEEIAEEGQQGGGD